jgi:hypothetical protein
VRKFWIAAVTIAALVVIGPVPSGEAATKGGLPVTAKAYVKAGALGTSAGTLRMQELARKNSYAWAYAVARTGLMQAAESNGQSIEPGEATFRGKKATVCATAGSSDCIELSSFELQGKKVVDFLREGQSFEGTLSVGGTTARALGSTLTLLGAYVTTEGDLVMSVEIDNGSSQLSFSYLGDYTDPDGRQIESSQQLTPFSGVQPNGVATIAFVFPDSPPGGTVIVTCSDPDTQATAEAELLVPVFSSS